MYLTLFQCGKQAWLLVGKLLSHDCPIEKNELIFKWLFQEEYFGDISGHLNS